MENKPPVVRAGVGVMILKEGKVLLGQRHVDPAKADSELNGEGTWTMPGGKIDFGNGIAEAAMREIKEETDLDVNLGDLKLVSLTNDANEKAHFVTIGFLCEKFSGEVKVMEPDEITKWEWFPIDNLPKPIFFPSQKIVERYKEGVIYKD